MNDSKKKKHYLFVKIESEIEITPKQLTGALELYFLKYGTFKISKGKAIIYSGRS